MSRFQSYTQRVSELTEIDDMGYEPAMIALMDELNKTMAMIADHLDQIEKNQRQVQRELGKRR